MNTPQRHRRSIRLKGYDYASAGAYFVTMCARERECPFGDVVGEEMRLNEYGRVAEGCLEQIPGHFPGTALDAFVVMPNHVHCIIIVGARHAVPLPRITSRRAAHQTARTGFFGRPIAGSVPTIIRSFKSAVTKCINERRATPGAILWQRNYYEHIIRDDHDLARIREYIQNNPAKWEEDEENPAVGTRHAVSLPHAVHRQEK